MQFSRNVASDLFFPNQFTFTAESGVGGTTMSKKFAAALQGLPYRFVSGGSIMRSFAAELDMTIEQFSAHNRLHPEEGYDHKCDNMACDFGKQDFVVAEGRTLHCFLPHAFHVKLVCDPEIRAHRRWSDQGEEKKLTEEKILQDILDRDLNDNSRYGVLYPGYQWEDGDYDLVIDTGIVGKDEMVPLLMQTHKEWLAGLPMLGRQVITSVVMPS